MIRRMLLALALMIAAADSAAANMAWGAGYASCREWQENRSAKNLVSLQQQSWIQGYLTGLNMHPGVRDFLVPKPDDDATFAWLDNYCAANPLAHLTHAINALAKDMIDRVK